MSVLFSMRTVPSVLVFAIGFWIAVLGTAPAQAVSCSSAPPASFDVREDPFNFSASERDAIMDVIHAFALTWDLRDEVNLPLLFIDGNITFAVCTSSGNVGGTGDQIHSAITRDQLATYFSTGPFMYVQVNAIQARHFIANTVVKNYISGDVKAVADLLVTLQHFDADVPIVDYTGMIEAILTKDWGGVWKFRSLIIYMDIPLPGADVTFRGR